LWAFVKSLGIFKLFASTCDHQNFYEILVVMTDTVPNVITTFDFKTYVSFLVCRYSRVFLYVLCFYWIVINKFFKIFLVCISESTRIGLCSVCLMAFKSELSPNLINFFTNQMSNAAKNNGHGQSTKCRFQNKCIRNNSASPTLKNPCSNQF